MGEAQKGEMMISNPVNQGTVLLNYRLGDIATLSRQRCSCGRSLPLQTDCEVIATDCER